MFVSKNCLFKSTLFCIPTATGPSACEALCLSVRTVYSSPLCFVYQQQQKQQQDRTVSFLLFNECFIKPGFFLVQKQKQKRKKPTVRLLYFNEILNKTQDPPRQANDAPGHSKKARRGGVRPAPMSTLVLGLEMTALHSV